MHAHWCCSVFVRVLINFKANACPNSPATPPARGKCGQHTPPILRRSSGLLIICRAGTVRCTFSLAGAGIQADHAFPRKRLEFRHDNPCLLSLSQAFTKRRTCQVEMGFRDLSKSHLTNPCVLSLSQARTKRRTCQLGMGFRNLSKSHLTRLGSHSTAQDTRKNTVLSSGNLSSGHLNFPLDRRILPCRNADQQLCPQEVFLKDPRQTD